MIKRGKKFINPEIFFFISLLVAEVPTINMMGLPLPRLLV